MFFIMFFLGLTKKYSYDRIVSGYTTLSQHYLIHKKWNLYLRRI